MNRSDLAALQTFVAIAEQGSLRAAARVLGVNPPAVSAQLKAFEARLGSALFLRSTRVVRLTDAGQALFDRSRHLVAGLDAALGEVRGAAGSRSGWLRITLPFRAWQLVVAPRLAAFQARFPGILLDLKIEEGLTDIVAQGCHAGIRLGDHLQDGMIAVPLSRQEPGAYVAAPEYLARHGVPVVPGDLLAHNCLCHRQISSGRVADWRFVTPEGEVGVAVTGGLVFNDLRSVVDAAVGGFGIGWSLRRGVDTELRDGRLVQVLADVTPHRPGFSLYFPKPLKELALLRAFIGHFRAP